MVLLDVRTATGAGNGPGSLLQYGLFLGPWVSIQGFSKVVLSAEHLDSEHIYWNIDETNAPFINLANYDDYRGDYNLNSFAASPRLTPDSRIYVPGCSFVRVRATWDNDPATPESDYSLRGIR